MYVLKAFEKIKLSSKIFFSDVAGPSENYWQVLAERRRIALKDALEKNKELVQCVEKLEEENRIYKDMLSETRALVEVLQVISSLYCKLDIAFDINIITILKLLYFITGNGWR